MDEFSYENYQTSGDDFVDGDVILEHREMYGSYYTMETGKTFVEICMDMGLDSDYYDIPFSF